MLMFRNTLVRRCAAAGGGNNNNAAALAAAVAAADAAAKRQQPVVSQRGLTRQKIVSATKEGLRHLYHGFRLFFMNTHLAWKYSRQLKKGVALTRRERLLLESSTKDLVSLVPFSFFIIIPFAELLLPVAMKIFPGLIPSTFETESQGRSNAFAAGMKTLRARQRVMDYMSATALGTFSKEQQEVIRRSVTGDSVTPQDIRLVAHYFSRDGPFGVYEIPSYIAVGMSRTVGAFKWYHSLAPVSVVAPFLRRRIIRQYHKVREDDRMLRVEGLDDLTATELIKANQTRCMRWTENKDTLRVQLEWWLTLARDPNVPYNTLFWLKPTRYSLRKSMNNLPVEQRRQLLGIQNLPESVRSSLEALCDTVGTSSSIDTEPDTADMIAQKVEDIADSVKKSDVEFVLPDDQINVGAQLTESYVKTMFEKLRKGKLEEEPVLISDAIDYVAHNTHNSSHVISTLFDTFDYGAGSKPITETELVSIGARCREAKAKAEKKEPATADAKKNETSESSTEKSDTGSKGESKK